MSLGVRTLIAIAAELNACDEAVLETAVILQNQRDVLLIEQRSESNDRTRSKQGSGSDVDLLDHQNRCDDAG